jgi:transposase-like protein
MLPLRQLVIYDHFAKRIGAELHTFTRSSQHLTKEVFMGLLAVWMQELTGREAMRSSCAPSHRLEIERRFWAQILTGITSERVAQAFGVSPAVGSRWFRHRGGMALFISKPISVRYLTFAERNDIGLPCVQGLGVSEIARRIGRNPPTVSRELRRNAANRCDQPEYWPSAGTV